eukprot:gene33672-41543_t
MSPVHSQSLCYQPKKVMNGRSKKAIIQNRRGQQFEEGPDDCPSLMEYDSDNEGVVPTRADLSKPYWMSAEEQAFYMEATKLEKQQVHIPVNISHKST